MWLHTYGFIDFTCSWIRGFEFLLTQLEGVSVEGVTTIQFVKAQIEIKIDLIEAKKERLNVKGEFWSFLTEAPEF